MIKNNELIKFISDDIRENPSTLIEDVIRDENFVNLFEGKSNHEIKGIIYDYPQNQNIFASVLYDRVISKGVVEGLEAVEKFKVFKREDLKHASHWYRLATDVKETKDFNPTASPIPTSESRKGIVYSNEPKRKLIEFTFSNEQLATAFESETGLSELLASEMKSVRDTISLYINDEIKGLIMERIEEEPKNFKWKMVNPGGSYAELLNFDTPVIFDENMLNIARSIKTNILNDVEMLSEPSRDFNIGDTDGGYMRNIPKGQGVLIIHSKLLSLLNIESDSLFGDKSNWEKYFKDIITISGNLKYGAGPTYTYGIFDERSIEYRIMLNKTLEWTNPRGLYTNYFTHLWLGTLVNPYQNALIRLSN